MAASQTPLVLVSLVRARAAEGGSRCQEVSEGTRSSSFSLMFQEEELRLTFQSQSELGGHLEDKCSDQCWR